MVQVYDYYEQIKAIWMNGQSFLDKYDKENSNNIFLVTPFVSSFSAILVGTSKCKP